MNRTDPPRLGVTLTDEEIVMLRDEYLPNQGEPFDCVAFARAIEHELSLKNRAASQEECVRLRQAISWAMGCGDSDFPPREPNEPSYWWRKHWMDRFPEVRAIAQSGEQDGNESLSRSLVLGSLYLCRGGHRVRVL